MLWRRGGRAWWCATGDLAFLLEKTRKKRGYFDEATKKWLRQSLPSASGRKRTTDYSAENMSDDDDVRYLC